MEDKKILVRPEKYRRTEGYKVSFDGEWREYSARALDAGECIYNEYVMWDMQGIPSEDDIISLRARARELDALHTRIYNELNVAVWSNDFAERYLTLQEYVMLSEVNDTIYAVLRSSMVNHSSDKSEEVQCGEDR